MSLFEKWAGLVLPQAPAPREGVEVEPLTARVLEPVPSAPSTPSRLASKLGIVPPSAPEAKPRLTDRLGLGTVYVEGNAELPPPKKVISASEDINRVARLPERPEPALDSALRLDPVIADLLRKPRTPIYDPDAPCQCEVKWGKGKCMKNLLPIQIWGLNEGGKRGGLFAPIGVGHGKTGIDLLILMAIHAYHPEVMTGILLVPANLRAQLTQIDIVQWRAHWNLPNINGDKWFTPGKPTLHVLSYNELSGARNSSLVSIIDPDVIIADEAHNLRNHTAARTKRFLRHFSERSGKRAGKQ